MPVIDVVVLDNGKKKIVQLDTDNLGGGSGDANVEGGAPDTVYLPDQCIDGGGP